jgi:hypothetical protein
VVTYHTLSGTVLDESGVGVGGVYVVYGSCPSGYATTDPDGHYEAQVPAGTYRLTLVIPPWSCAFGAALLLGPGPTVDLSTGDAQQDFQLPPRSALTVAFRDWNGAPLTGSINSRAGGSATMLPGDPTQFAASQFLSGTISGTAVYPVITGLAFGSGVSLTSLCVQYQSQYYCAPGFTVNGDTSVTITVPAPPMNPTISGTLIDDSGTPVSGARVAATSSLFGTTDANGHYSISVPPGGYGLTVLVGVIGSPFGPEWSTGPTPPVDVTAGSAVQNLRLPPMADLTVLVRDSNNVPRDGLLLGRGHGSVRLLPDDATLFPTTKIVNANTSGGSATFRVPDGLTFIGGTAAGVENLCAHYQNQRYCVASNVTVNGATTVTITVPAPPAVHTLSGTVVDENDTPIDGAIVRYGAACQSQVTTDGGGHYSVALPAGGYSLTLILPPWNCSSIAAPLSIGPGPSVDLTSGDVQLNLRLPTRSTLTVVMRDANGNLATASMPGSRASGSATLVAGDPTTFPASQALSGTVNGTAVFRVVTGLGFGSGVSFTSLCVQYLGQFYCAPAFTVNGDTTIVFQQQPPVPPAPTGLSAVTPTRNSPALTWNPVAGAASYRVLRDGQPIGTPVGPSFVDSALTTSGRYTYTVMAVNTQSVAGPASGPFEVVYDIDPPELGDQVWSDNPLAVGGATTLTVTATDALSPVDGGEYFVGADPGAGNGTTMTFSSGQLSATFGSALAPGSYDVGVRARDRAGNWSLVRTGQLVVQNPVSQLSALTPAKVWVGLKNSDDVGTKFDLLAEVYRDETLVTTGHLDNVPGGSSGFTNAKLHTIPFDAFAPVAVPSGSQLKIRLYVRNACVGPTHNSGTARLWYNDSAADSRFGATVGGSSVDYHLLSGQLLGSAAGPGPKKTVDVAAGAPCSAFKTFGTWTVTV